MDITCIVVGHHESHLIVPSIKSSIRAAEYASECGLKCEVIVLLDDPDENTHSVVDHFEKLSISIEIVFYKDLAQTRNHAVGIAKGEYVAFLDGDDMWCKTWIIDSYNTAKQHKRCILHPEYNIYFGDTEQHVLHHVGTDEPDFLITSIYRANYWTALTFSKRETFIEHRYKENTLTDGFGYEDWTWNIETISHGFQHLVVPGTCHYIRRTADNTSLLNATNSTNSLPRIYPIFNPDLKKGSLTNPSNNSLV